MVAIRYTCDTCLRDLVLDVGEDQRDVARRCREHGHSTLVPEGPQVRRIAVCQGQLVRDLSLSEMPGELLDVVKDLVKDRLRAIDLRAALPSPVTAFNFFIAQWAWCRLDTSFLVATNGTFKTTYSLRVPVMPLTGWIGPTIPPKPHRIGGQPPPPRRKQCRQRHLVDEEES